MRNWLSKDFTEKLLFHKGALKIVLGGFGGLFAYAFFRLLRITPEGVFIGQPNAWGDWAVHISITNLFANKPPSEWFLYHPFFAYGKLTYGFLVHLITAILMKIGFSLSLSFFIVSVVLLMLFLTGLYFLYFQLSNSRKQSVLAIFIFFTSSGMGIFRYLNTLKLKDIILPIQDYSRFVEYEWLAGNIPAAMLIPQRAFFIGITIGVWILNLLLWGLQKAKRAKLMRQKKLLFFAGILAGILPVAHMHSFITMVIITSIICFFHRAKFRQLIYFILPASILSTLFYFIFIHGGIQIADFFSISLGWTAPKNLLAWVIMWLQLWGTFLPLALFSILYFKKETQIKKYFSVYVGIWLVFLISNIIVFQPTKWDNTKLFAWVYLGLSILVSKFLLHLWNQSTQTKIVTFILLVTLSATGSVELIRIFNFSQNTYLLSSKSEIIFSQNIAKNTATDAVFLTSTAHNHPIPLWANRPIFLGYLGWIKNFGFDPAKRSLQTYDVFEGKPEANQILIENKISYIYLGPRERAAFNVNYKYLQQFPIAFQNENTVVYDTRQLWQ